MAQPRVIVIGAGLAGLSTACHALLAGLRALVFEHSGQPGGVSATWRRGAYVFDGGVHFYMGLGPGQATQGLYRVLGAAPACTFEPLLTYCRYQDPASGRGLEVTADLDRLERDLKAMSPPDHRFLSRFMAGCRAFAGVDCSLGLDRPPELSGVWHKLKTALKAGKAARWFGGPYQRPVGQAVAGLYDPLLRDVLARLFLPQVPLWFVMYLLGALAGGNLALCREGSAGFAGALEKRILDLGGEIRYRSTVTEVLVEGGRAVGVRLQDGSVHRAEAVVSAADGRSTLFDLLGGRHLDPGAQARYRDWELFNPLVLVTLGVKRAFTDEPPFQMIRPSRPPSAGFLADHWLAVRLFNYSPRFAPPGCTVVQVMADTAWEPWSRLRQDHGAYRAEKERLAQQTVAALEEVWPGLAAWVEEADVATPHTTWRYTLNHQGAYEGFLPTPAVLSSAKVPRTLPGLKGFYLAGQWVMPGGGVIPCLYSGRHAIELLCRDQAMASRAK